LVFIAKGWAKGFGIEDKNVEEIKYVCMYMCVHKQERKERKEKRPKQKREKPKAMQEGFNEG
jgi:hypothetical protein